MAVRPPRASIGGCFSALDLFGERRAGRRAVHGIGGHSWRRCGDDLAAFAPFACPRPWPVASAHPALLRWNARSAGRPRRGARRGVEGLPLRE